ncbi:hypothetical protein Tco_1185273 [Tanacetum coccineum]
MEAHLAPKQPVQVNKISLHVRSTVVPTTLNIAWKIPGKLLLITHLRVLTKRDASERTETPLLVGRGFLATANAVIDCTKSKTTVEEGITMSVFGVMEIDLGEEEAPYWITLGSLRIHIEQRIAAMMGYRGGRHMTSIGDVGSLYDELLRLKASLDVLFVPCYAAAERSHQGGHVASIWTKGKLKQVGKR